MRLLEAILLPLTIWHELWHFIPALLLGYRPRIQLKKRRVLFQRAAHQVGGVGDLIVYGLPCVASIVLVDRIAPMLSENVALVLLLFLIGQCLDDLLNVLRILLGLRLPTAK